MDKIKLLEYIAKTDATPDEREMWTRIGFYITKNAVAYNSPERLHKHFYVNPNGDCWHIPDFVAKSIRESVINWWSEESRKYMMTPLPSTDLDELEVQRG